MGLSHRNKFLGVVSGRDVACSLTSESTAAVDDGLVERQPHIQQDAILLFSCGREAIGILNLRKRRENMYTREPTELQIL